MIGRDAGELAGIGKLGVPLVSSLAEALDAAPGAADVVIDFSDPRATQEHLQTCSRQGVALLVGTTGLDAGIDTAAAEAATRIPLLIASNTSLGVTLLLALVREVARALPEDFDIEIIEAHHRHKKDAPSGTALSLGRAAAEGRQRRLDDVAVTVRDGVAPRREGDIGFAVVRGGDIVGDHTVLFAGPAERITLDGHHRHRPRGFCPRRASGRHAGWLGGRPGRYSMADIISLKT